MSSSWGGTMAAAARRYWAPRILAAAERGEPLECPFRETDPLCTGPVLPGQLFDVDHAHKRVDAGALGVRNQRPAHRSCNRRDGQRIARQRARQQHTRIRRWTRRTP